MKIEKIRTDVLGDVIAGLVRNGLTFRCYPDVNDEWTIELLGGGIEP